MEFTEDFYRREMLAIFKRWKEICKANPESALILALKYRLMIHPDLWDGFRRAYQSCYYDGQDVREFGGLGVLLDERIEGWLILPLGDVLLRPGRVGVSGRVLS